VFLDKLMGTLATIAKDVKIQVEFNPARVKSHKLLGYANRILQNEDFSNDRVDAGDIGSGHTVTAFYEVETTEGPPPARSLRYSHQEPLAEPIDASTEWLTVSLRYKQPGGHSSTRTVHPYIGVDRSMEEADADFRFATAVAMTAMALRDPDHEVMPDFRAAALLARTSLGRDNDGRRAEFVELLETLETLEGQHRRPLR
jgi:Ca-activated chloride channel family protein